MIEDPVVQAVRRLRQEHAARFDDDLAAIFADLKKTEEAHDPQESPLLQPPQEIRETPTNGTLAELDAETRFRARAAMGSSPL